MHCFFYSVLFVNCMNTNNAIYYYHYYYYFPTHSGSVSQLMHSILWKIL